MSAPVQPVPSSRRGRSLTLVLVLALVAATLGYYHWTSTVFYHEGHPLHRDSDDHFNLLARGFLKGQLSLDLPVPAALLHAQDPYDPAQRQGIGYPHDATYYQGKFYIYFGPAPVLTLFLPFKFLTGYALPLSLAVLLFSCGGYLALVVTFFSLQRRHYPHASRAVLVLSILALGGGSMVISLLRRPNIWEVSASAAFFYFSLSLLCLVLALSSRRATFWAACGGLALGLAVASRPNYALCCALFALPLLRSPPFRSFSRPTNAYGWRALLGAATTCALIVAGLLAYNYARFGQPFEFGQRYQLSTIGEIGARHFDLSYVLPNLHIYLLAPLHWSGLFPFVHPIAIPVLPPGHGGHEFSFGLLPNLPFVAFGLVLAATVCVPALRRAHDSTRWLALAVIAAAAVLTLAPLALFFGSCVRYMADFTPSFILLACLGLLEFESHLRHALARTLLQLTAAALALFSSAVAALALADTYNEVAGTPPPRYAPFARLLNAPVRYVAHLVWPGSRPWDLTLAFPDDFSPRREPLLLVGRASAPAASLFLDYRADRSLRFGYQEYADHSVPVFSPPLPVRPGEFQSLRITLGEPEFSAFDGAKVWLRLHSDGRYLWQTPAISTSTLPGPISVGAAPSTARSGLRFTGTIQSAAPARSAGPISLPAGSRPILGGRVHLTPVASLRGRSLPLATTGVTGAGDMLFVRLTANDELLFGYDHWGSPSATSSPVPIMLDRPILIEFWLPTLVSPADRSPQLVVTVDGRPVWQALVPFYPATTENLFLGYNPIGGTACEPVLDQGTIDANRVPHPPKN